MHGIGSGRMVFTNPDGSTVAMPNAAGQADNRDLLAAILAENRLQTEALLLLLELLGPANASYSREELLERVEDSNQQP